MTWINLSDVEAQLRDAGLVIDKALDFSAKIQRWKTADSKGADKPGWSRLKEWRSQAGNIYIVGCYGIWLGNDDGYTRIELPKRDEPERPALSDEDIAAAKAAQKAAAQAVAEQRKAEQKQAAAWAAQVWSKCQPATEHEYLARKQIKPNGARIWQGADDLRLPGIDDANHWRLTKSADALAVPMHDINGNVVGLQFIFPKGHDFEGKQFWPTGMAMGGSFGVIGGWRRTGVLCLTEGFATAATLAEATALPVAYAFSANNLGKAAKAIRAKYKQLRILVCADDDQATLAKTGKNPGVDAAQLAASEIELAAWCAPDFADESGADRRAGKKLSDFNDLALLGNPIEVTHQIAARLDALKWRDALPMVGSVGSNTKGGGESRPDAVSVMSLDDLVARFIPVDDGSGKVVFDNWSRRLVQRTQMVELLPAGVRGDDIKRHPVWQERGAVYADQVGFDPAGDDPQVKLNTWHGWPLTPKRGKCEKLLDLLWHLCSREGDRPDLVDWVLRWMAYPLQFPGAKMQSAIILHGEQGTGKSTIFKVLAEIYGYRHAYKNYAVVLDQKALEAKYNSDWDSKLYVLAEEVVNSSDKWQLKNELKEIVTGDRIRIEKKFLDAYYQANRCNIVFLSNEDQPLPLENKDRRHCVIYTPPALDLAKYADVRAEIAEGGVEAFYGYLMSINLADFKPWTRPPETEAKQALIDASRSSEDEFFQDWTAGETPFPVCACRGDDLFAAYLIYCQRIRERNVAPRRRFRLKLAHLHDWTHRKQVHVHDNYYYTGSVRQVRLEIPGDSWVQKAMQDTDYRQAPGETMAQWATRCMLDFAKALDDATPGLKAAA